jgi:hypothetical protein
MPNVKNTIFLSMALSIGIFSPAFAEELKKFALKDGSVIRGELISFDKGMYTVKSENLGQLLLSENNVVSVVNESLVPVVQAAPQAAVAPQAAAAGTGGFSSQVSAMQNQIMSNPQTMQAIQLMAEDPEIMSLISDPAFVQQLTAALSGNNIEGVASDPRIQKLMANPKMQALIQQIQPAASQ